jgi:hypothetical protein
MRVLANVVFGLSLGLSAPAAAQETVPLPIRIDGPARLELTLTKSDRRDDGPEQRATFTYDVALTKAHDEEGRRGATWRLTHVDGERVAAGASPSPDLHMTVDANLTPVSLDNLAEIIGTVRRQIEASGDLDQTGATTLQALAALNPETAAAMFARDATMIALGQGTDLFLGEDSPYEMEGVLPWGAANVLMIGNYRLVEVHRASGKARVLWSQEIEPTSLLAALPAMFEGLLGDKSKPDDSADLAEKMEAGMGDARLENDRRCEFMIDMATGLAEKIDCLTVIEMVAGEESARRETRLIATQRLVQ